MSTFKVTYKSGVVETETVQDCETVEHYVNRKFGSVDHEEYGTKVELVSESAESAEEEEEEEEEEDEKTEEKPKNVVMKVETGTVGSKLS